MERIIAGRFETKGNADVAAAVLATFVAPADIFIFHNNPPGQHGTLPQGGDENVDPEAKGAAPTSAGTALAAGLAAGAVGALGGPVVALAAAGIGAYSGSLVGALGGLGEDDSPSIGPDRRPAGILLSVRVAKPQDEDRVIAALRGEGAADIEHAQGTWSAGEWSDFNPIAKPQLVPSAA